MSSPEPIIKDCIPKKATQQEKFLLKYPEFDGRGIKIAVIDHGFDVSVPGLQKTSTGLPKVIDVFNYYWNVETSTIKEFEGENFLIGKSGRKFKIPSTWKNPSGKWHLGSDSFQQLFTQGEEEEKENNLKIKESDAYENSVVDCIVWNDGEKWRACITTSENLENAKVLTNFCDEHEYGFTDDKKICYCVKIEKDGNLLEIFTSSGGDHGTSVANTAAGYFPDKPNQSGLAPGAQIYLMNIFRTSDSVVKAVKKCIEMKVDIINFSIDLFLHPSAIEIIENAVQKHGIIIFNAAPNKGPVYNSAVEKGAYVNCEIFIIGSIIPYEIICKMNEKFKETPPSISLVSARGPKNTGIDFVAPGIILSSYPYRLKSVDGCYLGTSFAAPNAAGSIACLLSALKANSIQYSPTLLKFVLSNTAYLPENGDKLGYGDGIIQINSAFEFLKTHNFPTNFQIPKLSLFTFKKKLMFEFNQKGIYLIQKHSDRFSKKFSVKISEFNGNEISWILKVTPGGEKFVEFPPTIINGMFTINVNPLSLNPGSINFAEIHGFDSSNHSFGPLFKFPVTVIISKLVSKKENYIFMQEVILNPQIPYNIFIHPPFEYSKCTAKLSALEKITGEIFFKYAIENGANSDIFIQKTECCEYSIPTILNNQMIEICFFRSTYFENDSKNAKFQLEIGFQQISTKISTQKNQTKFQSKKQKSKKLNNRFR